MSEEKVVQLPVAQRPVDSVALSVELYRDHHAVTIHEGLPEDDERRRQVARMAIRAAASLWGDVEGGGTVAVIMMGASGTHTTYVAPDTITTDEQRDWVRRQMAALTEELVR